jgi:hypothetical protein
MLDQPQTSNEESNSYAGEDCYEKKLGSEGFEKKPHCIYFTYIGERDETNNNIIRHYYDPGDDKPIGRGKQLRQKIANLIANAQIDNVEDQFPPPLSADWKYLVMNRISYVVFAFDLTLNDEPKLLISQTGRGAPNYSFFDAELMDFDGTNVIVCINHMKCDEDYNEIEGDSQYFHFGLKTVPELKWPHKPSYPDSGGTNQGGTTPPPYN